MKERQVNFIKGFSSISVNKICKELNISRANLVAGRLSADVTDKVYKMLVVEFTNMINEVLKNEQNDIL